VRSTRVAACSAAGGGPRSRKLLGGHSVPGKGLPVKEICLQHCIHPRRGLIVSAIGSRDTHGGENTLVSAFGRMRRKKLAVKKRGFDL